MNEYDLAGKRAIVTGGAGGIGRAIAARLIASGARVSLWDIAASGLAEAVGALAGGTISRIADITDEAAVAGALAADRAEFGRIDVLVNNAGILGAVMPIWQTDPADLRRVIEVNLIGAMLCTRAVLAAMRAQDRRPHRGHIVNVSSIQAKEGMSLGAAYSASKAGLVALTKSAAKDVAGDAILVNCITPAAAETAMAREITAERRADIIGRIPLGRFVELDEIARMVAWLVSDDCSFSTGATFDLSGGRATF
jgi:NAD(P)-dependent dehydrogenase (short-subunit alcohol dehydrogenase family)